MMKLGLLVLLAVAVLVPGESEGRIVSKCELREKLWRMMPKSLCDRDKDRVLAMVICELRRRSNLNTTYEMVLGERPTAAAMDSADTSDEGKSEQETSDEGKSEEETSDESTEHEGESSEDFTAEEMTTADTSNEGETTEKKTGEEILDQFGDFEFDEEKSDEGEFEEFDEAFTTKQMTTADTSTAETTTEKKADEENVDEDQVSEFEFNKADEDEYDDYDSDEAFTTEKMTTADTSTEEMANEALTTEAMSDKTAPTTEAPAATPSTAAVRSTAAAAKRRRKRDIFLFGRRCVLPLWRINEKLNDMDSGMDEVEKELAENMVHVGEEEEMMKPWSLGCHGLFQLSDGYFCQTDHRYSANACGKSCSAFTDDDLTDDLECIEKMAYWRYIFREASIECYYVKDYFSDCD